MATNDEHERINSAQRSCTHHDDKDAWTDSWHCRHCGLAWGVALIDYFRQKAAAGDHPELNTRVADTLEYRKE